MGDSVEKDTVFSFSFSMHVYVQVGPDRGSERGGTLLFNCYSGLLKLNIVFANFLPPKYFNP